MPPVVKKCEIQSGGKRNGFGNSLMEKILPLAYHHSHFLATILDFKSLFTTAFLGVTHFFYSWAVLD